MRRGALLADRFEIEHPVGTGGMGQVFRARDRASGQQVAVKVLSDVRGHRTARFVREVALLAELFLAMEWLDGEDLEVRLAREPLTVGQALALATRVAEALGAAHARGIVHRDLKPGNLFLPGGRVEDVKVLDFGIAQREGGTQLTQTGTMIGTPGYMAPEQARNQGVIGARADVFALGCVLFQCLTGVPAFEGDSAAGILGKLLFGQTPRLAALWPEVPAALDDLVAAMLDKEPAQRPSDGASLATALAEIAPRVPSAAVVRGESTAKAAAITGSELRLLSVILLGRAAAGAPAGTPAGTPGAEQAEDELLYALRPFGGHLEQLADGSAIVVLEADRGAATDQAAQAARCALALREVAGGRPIAIALGRTELATKLPEDDVIDRASRLLTLAPAPPNAPPGAAPGPPPIAIDEVIAGLLDARFDVVERDAGLVLCGERELAQGARTRLGRPTSCVGRDWELGALESILDECIEEPGLAPRRPRRARRGARPGDPARRVRPRAPPADGGGPRPLGARGGAPPDGRARRGRARGRARARDGGAGRAPGRPGDARGDPARAGPRRGGARRRRGGDHPQRGDGGVRPVPRRVRAPRPRRGAPRDGRQRRRAARARQRAGPPARDRGEGRRPGPPAQLPRARPRERPDDRARPRVARRAGLKLDPASPG
ncbi:MAG TPA: serine/threonine-protein kinase [Kofleriaceae bacterium]|nr:serine/threonine-protein kinase [Kofleriaceae bacterium]